MAVVKYRDMYGDEDHVVVEYVERRRGLRWLFAKALGLPVHCHVTERLSSSGDTNRCTVLRKWLP